MHWRSVAPSIIYFYVLNSNNEKGLEMVDTLRRGTPSPEMLFKFGETAYDLLSHWVLSWRVYEDWGGRRC